MIYNTISRSNDTTESKEEKNLFASYKIVLIKKECI